MAGARSTLLLNYALWQTGWLACVLGAAHGRPWLGAGAGCVLALVHLALTREPKVEARLMLLAAALGGAVESYQLAGGTYTVTSGMWRDQVAPAWLLVLWLQFATTFRYCLWWLVQRPERAALGGALGGPLACLAADRLGALTLTPPMSRGLLRLAFVWAIVLPVLGSVAARPPEEGSPVGRYRGL